MNLNLSQLQDNSAKPVTQLIVTRSQRARVGSGDPFTLNSSPLEYDVLLESY